MDTDSLIDRIIDQWQLVLGDSHPFGLSYGQLVDLAEAAARALECEPEDTGPSRCWDCGVLAGEVHYKRCPSWWGNQRMAGDPNENVPADSPPESGITGQDTAAVELDEASRYLMVLRSVLPVLRAAGSELRAVSGKYRSGNPRLRADDCRSAEKLASLVWDAAAEIEDLLGTVDNTEVDGDITSV